MMKKILSILGIVLVAYIILVVIAWNKPPSGQQKWITTQLHRLEQFDPKSIDPNNTSKCLPEGIDDGGIDEFHSFKDGGWIYVISHSSHVIELNRVLLGRSGVQIGDIAVALDNDGNIYQTENHVCAGVFTPDKEIRKLDEFLSTMTWKKINNP